jgi:hypothetical protein
MRKISGNTVLLHDDLALPGEIQLTSGKFTDSWKILHSGDARWLHQRIHEVGWHYNVAASKGFTENGIGRTKSAAVVCALKLALLKVSANLNGVEVTHIEMKTYPWFSLARVGIGAFRIQEAAPQIEPEAVALRMLSVR